MMNNSTFNIHHSTLGLVPNGPRPVTPIPPHLKKLVPTPTGQNETVKSFDADPVRDTVPMIKRLIKRQAWQGKALAQALRGATLEETLRNNWNFIFRHIQYTKDPEGRETVRSLRRLVYDGRGDCDCFVNALGNLLYNQRIPFSMRVAKYNGASHYSHIYIVVPKAGGGHYTLDPVVHQFNHEVPYTAKKDFAMKLESLDGLGTPGSLGACPPKTATTTANATATTTAQTDPKTLVVTSQLLADEGQQSVAALLFEEGYQYQPVPGGYQVETTYGTRIVPSVVPASAGPGLLASLQQPPPPPTEVEETATKALATSELVGWGTLAAIVTLAVWPGNKPKPAVAGIARSKKTLPVAQL